MIEQTRGRGLRSGIASGLAVVAFVLAALLVTSITPAGAAPKQKPQCADRIDNDGDGLFDYARKGGDPDCTSRQDGYEASGFRCTDSEGDGTFEMPPPLPNAGRTFCDFQTGEVLGYECATYYFDLNGMIADGCEYGPIHNVGPEQCDGIDNDADGQIDDGLVPPPYPNGEATCANGTWVYTCNPGFDDANGDLSDGCEATVPTFANSSREVP